MRHELEELMWGFAENYEIHVAYLFCLILFGIISLKRRKDLKDKENQLKILFERMPNPIFLTNEKGQYIDGNEAALKFLECTKNELCEKDIWDFCPPYLVEESKQRYSSIPSTETIEVDSLVNGKIKTLLLSVVPIKSFRKHVIWNIGQDITQRKQIQKQLEYMSFYDPLTKLYNRAYFERKVQLLGEKGKKTIGIIVCDIDGLKLANDTFGHDTGDVLLINAANMIKNVFKEEGIVARMGGDEFSILVEGCDEADIENDCSHIQNSIDSYNHQNPQLPLSISIGYAVGNLKDTSIQQLLIEADNHMYRKKFQCNNSTRSHLVHALMKTLEEKDIVTKEHVSRLYKLILNISKKLNLPKQQLKDLSLLAQFHDIGKIGVPDHILNKPGRLTKEEYEEMKHHSEIGYRIINSIPNLSVIAQFILKHHEWGNGSGYPLGLEGGQIPVECRIFTILDTYDVIRNERPYKKAMSHEEAIEEIKRCAGTQFDPDLTQKLVEILENIHHTLNGGNL